MNEEIKYKLIFSKKDLDVISHGLYLIIYSSHSTKEEKEISGGLQRMISPLLRGI